MTTYIGLNVSFRLNDVNDKEIALNNVGLDIRDLDIIRGIQSQGISSTELQLLSGLDLDQEKELYSISRSSSSVINSIQNLSDIQLPLAHNYRIDDQLRASSIKYNFLDYSNNTVRNAEISTSRVSSWSSLENPATANSDIFYGSEVEVIGNDVSFSSLSTTQQPIPVRYPQAETPTHLITIDINGSPKQFYAMKGIPLQFETFFRNASFTHEVTPISGSSPVWRIENVDDENSYENTTIGNEGTYSFRDVSAKERIVEFYFNPANITRLEIPSVNLREFPQNNLTSLTYLNIVNNDFYELPDFQTITPSLETLIVSGNNLSRAVDISGNQIVANTQLAVLPTSLVYLDISGCFSDSTKIDISALTNLETFLMSSRFDTYSRRGMLDTGSSPKINSSSIKSYNIREQRYTQLDTSVTTSTSLESLDIIKNNITLDSANSELSIASTNLKSFFSENNSHQIVDVSGKTLLINYSHRYSTNLSGDTSIEGKFTGCTALKDINLYSTAATGNINTAFANLGSLEQIDIRFTSVAGNLEEGSFTGTTNLRGLNIAGSSYDTENFFGNSANTGVSDSEVFYDTPDIAVIRIYNNTNIGGWLPDFSTNTSLSTLYIAKTGIGGTIPAFSTNTSLVYLGLINNNHTGSVPAFNGTSFRYIYLNNNSLSGEIQELVCPNLLNLRLSNNNLSGSVPSFVNCPRLRNIQLQGNSITNYVDGSIVDCSRLSFLDLSNNNLVESVGRRLINDLADNYFNNPRGGVVINLLGNTNLTEEAILADNTARTNLEFLRESARWTISI